MCIFLYYKYVGEKMLVIEIKVNAKDDKNSDIQVCFPLALAQHLKLKEHIPFLKDKYKAFLQALLLSLKEEAHGLLIEVDDNYVSVKVEVKEYAS